MRAEAEAGFTIPPVIHEQIQRHLIACTDRDLDFPIDHGKFSVAYKGIDGRASMGKETIGYLWYPWAIGGCRLWLNSAERHAASPEDQVRVRRALGNLVITLGDNATKETRNNMTFIPSELLFNLSVGPPSSPNQR